LASEPPYGYVELPAAAQELVRAHAPLDFTRVYESWFDPCLRWLRALGIADTDLEDLGQEVFVIVERKLARFEGDRLQTWIYRIAVRVASDHRRRAWVRRLWGRGSRVDFDDLQCRAPGPGPVELLEHKEARRQLDTILARMSEKRRVAFSLFEIEGYSGEEIAVLLDVPLATVWTRLHHARKEFLAFVAELKKEGHL
jgi:RNA polymerase sigma-70 factor (ECF subfamily)